MNAPIEVGPAQWCLECPGKMVLPDTEYAITWDGKGFFRVCWNGSLIGLCAGLEAAQDKAMEHMKNWLKMGLQPDKAD